MYNALTEEAVTASTAEVFQRAAIPVIDIIVDCFSVNNKVSKKIGKTIITVNINSL